MRTAPVGGVIFTRMVAVFEFAGIGNSTVLIMTQKHDDLTGTKKLMGALLRKPPKPHEDMKLGKRANKKGVTKSVSKKPKAKKDQR